MPADLIVKDEEILFASTLISVILATTPGKSGLEALVPSWAVTSRNDPTAVLLTDQERAPHVDRVTEQLKVTSSPRQTVTSGGTNTVVAIQYYVKLFDMMTVINFNQLQNS